MIQESITNILIFRTNIDSETDFLKLSLMLNSHPQISSWNVDRHDVDKVLRVVSDHLIPDDIVALLNTLGLYCQELPD